ncbi:MAG: BatA domain-containing protein [Gemmatimonadaceae bacterium]
MPLAFLTPLFLAGLALVAVPIWVHLRNRERKGAIEFPSLMFLRRIPYHSVRRQRIRNWPLFLLRALAVALVAAAFARPFFDRAPSAASAGADRSRELVVLLDRSYSMGHGDRWTRATRAVDGALSALGAGDRASVVLFDAVPEAVTEPTSDRAALHAAVAVARPGSGPTRYAPALRMARQLVAASDRPRREVLLVSDFQRGGWDGAPDARLPGGTALTLVNVAEGRAENVAVTGVTTRRAAGGPVARVAVQARVTRTGGTGAARTVPLALEINGRAMQTKSAVLDSSGAATVAFDPVPLPDGVSRAVVRASADALPADDAFYFTLAPGASLRALVLEAPGAPPARSFYLRQALGVGEGAVFDVQQKGAGQLGAADLAGRALVILDDAPAPQGDAGRRLADWVRAGGGLVVALGERSAPGAWDGPVADLLPLTPGAAVDRLRDRGGTLGFVDYAHPALSLFATPRSGDLSAARFFRYRAATPVAGAEVLARFDDGAIALAERRVGRGRVLAWTSGLDNVWNDMPVQPVWVPFVHGLARHAASWTEPRQWLSVGQVLDPAQDLAGAASDSADWVARTPAGATEVVAGGARRTLTLSQQGFYLLRRQGEAAIAARPVAVNLDTRESDLAPMDPEELRAAVLNSGSGASPSGASAEVDDSPAARERRQAVWWYLLAAALVLLAAEAAVSNRRAMRRA